MGFPKTPKLTHNLTNSPHLGSKTGTHREKLDLPLPNDQNNAVKFFRSANPNGKGDCACTLRRYISTSFQDRCLSKHFTIKEDEPLNLRRRAVFQAAVFLEDNNVVLKFVFWLIDWLSYTAASICMCDTLFKTGYRPYIASIAIQQSAILSCTS